MVKENNTNEKDKDLEEVLEDITSEAADETAGSEQENSEAEKSSFHLDEDTTKKELTDQLADLERKLEEKEDRSLRLQAEIANMKRSSTRERQDAAKYRSQSLAQKLLDAMDNLERALEVEAESEDAQAVKKGVEMVYNQIIQAFKEENIEVLNPINEAFDPNFHQAVTTQPAAEGEDTDVVVNVLQKGYLLNDRVIRPAMVIVSA